MDPLIYLKLYKCAIFAHQVQRSLFVNKKAACRVSSSLLITWMSRYNGRRQQLTPTNPPTSLTLLHQRSNRPPPRPKRARSWRDCGHGGSKTQESRHALRDCARLAFHKRRQNHCQSHRSPRVLQHLRSRLHSHWVALSKHDGTVKTTGFAAKL